MLEVAWVTWQPLQSPHPAPEHDDNLHTTTSAVTTPAIYTWISAQSAHTYFQCNVRIFR